MIYLDNNATTKVDEQVLEEMLPYLKDEYANPSSMYTFATKPANAIKEAREKVKDFLGANNEKEIFFTSCGSESANMAIKGALSCTKEKKHIITTKVEHPCVLNTYKEFEKRGYEVDYISVDSHGVLNIDELKEKVRKDTALVSVMWANNETGVINPVAEISDIIKTKSPDTLFYVDAVQAAGKVPINVKETQIDMLGISGHKFHAPKGVGALYIKPSVRLTPLITGGHQEKGLRAGTENVPYIVGIGKAAEAAGADALSMINTITGMKIDIEKRKFALANKTGGMSGPAVKPVAVRMVYQCANAVSIPIIGMGGIQNAEDAIEFLMAGATAVAAGAMNFVNPYLTEEMVTGIDRFLERHNIADVNEIIGCVK